MKPSFDDLVAGSGARKKLRSYGGSYKDPSGVYVSLGYEIIPSSHGNKGVILDPGILISSADADTQQKLKEFAASSGVEVKTKPLNYTGGTKSEYTSLKFPRLNYTRKPVTREPGESQKSFLLKRERLLAANEQGRALFEQAVSLLDPATANNVKADLNTIKNAFPVVEL
jgi:hypothetical protein